MTPKEFKILKEKYEEASKAMKELEDAQDIFTTYHNSTLAGVAINFTTIPTTLELHLMNDRGLDFKEVAIDGKVIDELKSQVHQLVGSILQNKVFSCGEKIANM